MLLRTAYNFSRRPYDKELSSHAFDLESMQYHIQSTCEFLHDKQQQLCLVPVISASSTSCASSSARHPREYQPWLPHLRHPQQQSDQQLHWAQP